MKIKPVIFGIVLLSMVITNGFGITFIEKIPSIYAKESDSTKDNLATCKTVTIPKSSSINETFTVAEKFKGNPMKFNGECVMDSTSNSAKHPCNVIHGIASSGHCETVGVGYAVTSKGTANLPTIEWHHLAGVTLKPGQFLDLADTTPFFTTKGHSATVIPCDKSAKPLVRLFAGIIDAGVNTLESPDVEYLQQLSSPQEGLCVYHFDVGTTTNNPDGVTDFAIINTSDKTITFTDRNPATLSVTNGYLNAGGG